MSIAISLSAWQHQEEERFAEIRRGIIGDQEMITTPYGIKPLIYADWCASGRLYAPIETYMKEVVAPYIGNTHTDSNATGASMTQAYSTAIRTIKRHVHAVPEDIVLFCGTGMTGAVVKLQRLLNLRIPEGLRHRVWLSPEERPVIFITHMEHHSNHTSWLETVGEVVLVPPDSQGRVSPAMLQRMLQQYSRRPCKIGAFTACSNVTGLKTPLHELAKMMHLYGGLAFADYSASAPYDRIDMHPEDPLACLDAIYFSPHKFLGGPGTNGVLVMDSRLVSNRVPDIPGGGTVIWTNPWGRREYVERVEEREDGGTPGFLQAVRTALCVKLKEEMGTEAMQRREKELLDALWPLLHGYPGITILEGRHRNRQATVSVAIEGVHYMLATRLLNDRFGIQARGGCSCAGSYGHFLFGIGEEASDAIYEQIKAGSMDYKPGWVRISLHPVMTAAQVKTIGEALQQIATHGKEWARDYRYNRQTGQLTHMSGMGTSVFGPGEQDLEESWERLFKHPLQRF